LVQYERTGTVGTIEIRLNYLSILLYSFQIYSLNILEVSQLVSETKDYIWGFFRFSVLAMARSTKNSSTSDDNPIPSQLEHQVTGMETVMGDLSTRLNNTESQVEQLNTQFTQFAAQFSGIPAALQQLSDKMDRNQSAQTISLPASKSPPPRVERTVPVHTSIPYQLPNSRLQDAARSTSFFQDHPRRDDDWRQPDSSQKWLPPRTDLTKFDGTNLTDWIEDVNTISLYLIYLNFTKSKQYYLF
jgi:uncharacterized coiled-coil protein SlyX